MRGLREGDLRDDPQEAAKSKTDDGTDPIDGQILLNIDDRRQVGDQIGESRDQLFLFLLQFGEDGDVTLEPTDGVFVLVLDLETETRNGNLLGVEDDHQGLRGSFFVGLALFLGGTVPTISGNANFGVGRAADGSGAILLVERMSPTIQIDHVREILFGGVIGHLLEGERSDADVLSLFIIDHKLAVILLQHLIALDPQLSKEMQLFRVFLLFACFSSLF